MVPKASVIELIGESKRISPLVSLFWGPEDVGQSIGIAPKSECNHPSNGCIRNRA